MPEISITERGMVNFLEKLNYHKAAEPETLQPVVLKHLAVQVAPILKVIYTRYLEFHQVPDDWRLAKISPVYKKATTTVQATVGHYHWHHAYVFK